MEDIYKDISIPPTLCLISVENQWKQHIHSYTSINLITNFSTQINLGKFIRKFYLDVTITII